MSNLAAIAAQMSTLQTMLDSGDLTLPQTRIARLVLSDLGYSGYTNRKRAGMVKAWFGLVIPTGVR